MSAIAKKEDPNDEEEYLSRVRQHQLKKIRLSLPYEEGVAVDIHRNVRIIRAILKTNKEIFDRCIPSAITENVSYFDNSYDKDTEHNCVKSYDDHNDTGVCTMARFDVTQVFTTQDARMAETTIFSAVPTRLMKRFQTSLLSKLPAPLKIFKPTFLAKPYSRYIDYEALFKISLILRDDALLPFLVHLKEHLMSIQVCLGEIDEWLMKKSDSLLFLETLFGKVPRLDNEMFRKLREQRKSICKCPLGHHETSLKCLMCTVPFEKHKADLRTCTFKCPGRSTDTSFHCRKPASYVLKKYTSTGKHHIIFDISNECGREKLRKFFDFVQVSSVMMKSNV